MRVLLVLVFLVGNYPVKNSRLNFLIESYANATAAVANYFTSACIYLLSNSEEQDAKKLNLIEISRYISLIHGKLNTVVTFTEYFKMLNSSSDMELCYLPLHVVIDNGDDKNIRETFAFHSGSITGAEQQDGGVWLIFLKSLDPIFIEKYFQIMYTPFDVEIIVASISTNQVHMIEIYRVAPGYPLRQPYFGNWSLEEGMKAPEKKMPYTRRNNLEGLELIVGYRISPPMTIIKTDEDGNKIASGFIGDIWNVILNTINASARYLETEEVGVKINDTYTGLLGKLKNKEIDIALTPFIINRDRFDVIEFSHPLFENRFQIFFQTPGTVGDVDGFLLPFDTELWLTIGGWLFVGSFFLYLGCRITDFWIKTEENFTISETFFMVFNALCCQGSEKVPKTISNRIIFFLTFVIATIVIPAYSASLISYLTITEPVIPFTNLEEFYNNNEYKLIVRGGGRYEYDLFSDTHSNGYAFKIFERDLKSNKNLPKSYDDAIIQLCQDKHSAFFGIEASMEWNLDRTKQEREKSHCMITKMITHAGKVNLGLGFPLNSHYKCLINYQIRNLQSIGIDERIRDLYWIKHDNDIKEMWTPVNINNVFLIFVLFVVGIIMSSVIFIVEFILRYKKLMTVVPTTNTSNLENNLREVVVHPSFFNLTTKD